MCTCTHVIDKTDKPNKLDQIDEKWYFVLPRIYFLVNY